MNRALDNAGAYWFFVSIEQVAHRVREGGSGHSNMTEKEDT